MAATTRDLDTRALRRSDPGTPTQRTDALDHQSVLPRRPATTERHMADAIRALTIDAVDTARSGHPGLPVGMADVATVLWSRILKFDAADPRWPDRDRFVLSAGHGAMLLYALLHLTGHAGMDSEALRRFRQIDSPAAGHPEYGDHPAIETTTGPIGQGLATAVGLALAERMMAARFGRSLVDHRTWVVASDGDLMEGISHEAACLAGHLRLEKLTVLWDDNGASLDGSPNLSSSDEVLKRFAAYGWATKRVDGHNPAEIAAALSFAMRSKKPTLIACRTILGFAAPSKAGTAASTAGRLAPSEADEVKQALDWNHPPFEIPEDLGALWRRAGERGNGARRAWLKRLAKHPLRPEFDRVVAGRLPEAWHEAVAALKSEFADSCPTLATCQSSQRIIEMLAAAIPELTGGSADLAGSTLPHGPGLVPVTPVAFAGRYINYGAREHAMAACLNGLALHGGFLPFGGTLLVFSDYMRPALRLAALMRQRVVHVLTHDSIGLGQDGATHQPIEHLASLRAVPGLALFRPADAIETVECWELAIRRADGPSLLVLSRQPLPAVRTEAGENRCARGGYVLAEADGPRQATLIATGSEVSVALQARRLLADAEIHVAVVSLPCWEQFELLDETTRAAILGPALRVGIEAACGFGWDRWLGPDGIFIGMTGYGASAPADVLYRHFGITPEAIATAVRKRLPPSSQQQGT